MEESNAKKNRSNNIRSINVQATHRNILLIFIVLFIIGLVGYFSTESHWIEFTFAHLGGLGILGVLGSFAGLIAKKKGFIYLKALSLGIILPILLGTIPVFLFKPIPCGGSVSLAVSVLIVLYYSIAKRRVINKVA